MRNAFDIRTEKLYAREEGLAEGRAEGEVKANREIAKRMLEMELPLDVIVQATGLSSEEIKSLS